MFSRRNFLTQSLTLSAAFSALAQNNPENQEGDPEIRYIAAYDTESPNCLNACRKIVEVHKRFAMPATFFLVGKTLEASAKEYRELLDDPLFEIASHTYSHRMLKDNPFCGSAISPEQKRVEIFKGKKIIEDVFERPCIGLRSGCGFVDGFKQAPDVLALIREAGYQYVSSLLWGPDYSMPALLTDPFRYTEEGFSDIWEIPGHGWHENLLKNHNKWGAKRLTLWPPPMPEAIPKDFVKTPKDEFAINRVFLDQAIEQNKRYVSLIWHPWSLGAFDAGMKMLELTFAYVRKTRLRPCTFGDYFHALSNLSRNCQGLSDTVPLAPDHLPYDENAN